MDRSTAGRWMGKHPVIVAFLFAAVMAAPALFNLILRPSFPMVVITLVALLAGAGFGLLLSLAARPPGRNGSDQG